MTLKDPTSTNVLSDIFWEAACARHRIPLFRNSQFSRCWLESGGHTYRQVTNMQVRWWLFEQSSSFFQSYLIFPLPPPTARNQKCSPKEFLSQRLWEEERVWGVQHQTSVTQMHLSKGRTVTKKDIWEISLVVQWLRICASTAGVTGLIPAGELRSHRPHCATKKKPNSWVYLSYTCPLLVFPCLFCFSPPPPPGIHWPYWSISFSLQKIESIAFLLILILGSF